MILQMRNADRSLKLRRMKQFGALLFIIAGAASLTAQPIVSESKVVDVDHPFSDDGKTARVQRRG
jgi:hypothetical protein